MKDFSKNWKQYAVWAAICGCLYGLYWLGYNAGFNPPSPPIPVLEQFKTADGSHNFGWHNDPEAVAGVVQALPFKVFADTPAGNVAAVPDHFYQWEIFRKADPRGPPCKNQGNVGSCVSFGTNNAILRTMACQIALNGAAEELHDIVEEVTYGGSRVQIGGGRIRGDGSVGAWAAQFAQKYGILARGLYLNGKYDLSAYDTTRCRAWGSSGVPADLIDTVKEHFVKDITQVKTLDDLKRAISQGYGVAVCSGQGFSMQRDGRGVARAQGSWGHCMCLDGYQTDAGKDYFHIENSWGPDAHTGPVGWGNPSTAGFYAEAPIVKRMLDAGDTWAFSGVRGFPARDSNWFVRLDRGQDTRAAALKKELLLCPALFALCP